MSPMEKAALQHVREYLEYRKSGQEDVDLKADAALRAKRDIAAGHLPTCTLSKCHPKCKQA